MNYRHAYHAGNFADVVKHVVLTLILEHLKKKTAPFAVLDMHAGIGRYDLQGEQSTKTGESIEGIHRLLTGGPLPSALSGYESALKAINPNWPELRFYPGSPRIVRTFLRPQDRLITVELHPEDVRTLRHEFRNDHQVEVHEQDAYVALKALLPPVERRGMVLIDPPFEVTDEFHRIVKGLTEALRRWQNGIFGIWYPIKEREPVERFLLELGQFGFPCLTAEFFRFPPEDAGRLNGCGFAFLNPPWQLDENLAEVFPILAERLGALGETAIRWIHPRR